MNTSTLEWEERSPIVLLNKSLIILGLKKKEWESLLSPAAQQYRGMDRMQKQ